MTERNLRTCTLCAGLAFLACLAIAVAGWLNLATGDLNEHQAHAVAVATGVAIVSTPVALLAAVAAASLEPPSASESD